MKRLRISDALIILLFIAAICTVTAVTFLQPEKKTSFYEQRNLSEFPVINAETVIDGSWINDLESWFCDRGAWRDSILQAKADVELKVLRRPVVNDVHLSDDGFLLGVYDYETVDEKKIRKAAGEITDDMAALKDVIEGYGGVYLYCSIPSHYAWLEDSYPKYLNNREAYTKASTGEFFRDMDERGIPYLKIEDVWNRYPDNKDFMSTLDHHFTWKGIFTAYQGIMQQLDSMTDYDLDILTEDELIVDPLPNPYLGSYARKLCGVWNNGEPLTYAELQTPIPFTRYDNGSTEPSRSFTVKYIDNAEKNVDYSLYMGGDNPETIIRTSREDHPDILIYGDSFTNALETLIYASADEMRSLDYRGYDDMSLTDYVQTWKPDIVLCVRDYEQLLNPSER